MVGVDRILLGGVAQGEAGSVGELAPVKSFWYFIRENGLAFGVVSGDEAVD